MTITFAPHSLKSHTVDKEGRRAYTVRYLVSASASEGPVSVRQAFDTAVPLGTAFTYGSDTDTYAIRTRSFSVTPSRQGGSGTDKRWFVDAMFDTMGDDKCQDDTFEGEPWTWPWSRRSGSTRKTLLIDDDKDGKELKNTAEIPYWPAPEVEQIDDVIILSGNLLSVDFFQWAEFKARGGAVNSTDIGPFPERTLRIVDMEWTEAFYGTCTSYYQCVVSIAVNSDTWDLEVVQVGFKNFFGIDNGSSEPSFLDQNGSFIKQADLQSGAESPFVKTHRIHNEKDFSQIGFPMTLLTT